ncbi:MAG TPA: hypothetical protein PKL84_11625, partial [Candidatus Hydrogenedentes bacterium]|nr:hypothetical protein [Candidatus Hydrogenedentota bacterium]
MLDIKLLRDQPDVVRAAIERRGADIDLDGVLAVDARWRALTHEWEQLRAEQNRAGEEIARFKREKQDAAAAIAAMKQLSEKIKALDDERRDAETKLRDLVIATAEQEGIPLQFSAMAGGATDGAQIHMHDEGVPTVVIAVPTRHIH